MWKVELKFPVKKWLLSGEDCIENLSKIHSFSYNSQSFDFKGSKIGMVATGFLDILISHTLTLRKSLAKIYLPFLEKQASEILATISVKKFFLEGSSFSAKVKAV